ncbi:MAG TPA: hypothetical protein VKT77_01755 [Chthonomonadaceae bacterium]|nr:hypothetical protein [Chthonomonadaceae bacterium]
MRPALSRLFSPCLFVLTVALLLVGCGGGGNGSSRSSATAVAVTAARASGRAVLPAGFALKPATLTVASSVDDSLLKADATFSLRSPGSGPALTVLKDPGGKPILFGFIDNAASGSPQAAGNGEISPTQTAVALLFYTLGLFTVPSSQWQHARDLIAQSPQSAQLATVISSRIAANPTALADGDPQILDAITQARQAVQPGSRAASSVATAPQSTASADSGPALTTVTISRAAGDPGVLIDPPSSEERSGVNVNVSPDNTGIVLVNHARRRAAVFIYEVATVDSQGIRTDLATPKPMTFAGTTLVQALFNPGNPNAPSTFMEVAPANALNGTFGALSDVIPSLVGNPSLGVTVPNPNTVIKDGAWVAQSTGPITLPPDGAAAQTIYKVVLVGPSFSQKNDVTTSLLATDPTLHFTAFAPQWQQVVTLLSKEQLVLDIIFPLVSSVVLTADFESKLEKIGSTGVIGTGNLKDDIGILADFIALVGSAPDIVTSVANATNGDFSAAMKSFAQVLVDSGDVRTRVTEWLLKRVSINYPPDIFGPPKNVADEFKASLENFSKAASVADLLLALADVTRITHDSIGALPVQSWDVTVVPPKVSLTPAAASVSVDQTTVQLTATPGAPGDPKAPFVYHYAVSGSANGGIEDSTHISGLDKEFDSVDAAITYAMSGGAVIGQTDTVTVQVFANTGNFNHPVKGTLMGQAQSVVTVQQFASGCGVLPAPIAGTFGDATTPGVVHPGDTIAVTVTIFNKKPNTNSYALFLQDFVEVNGGFTDPKSNPLAGHVTAATLDGEPVDVTAPIVVTIPNGNTPNEQHIVTFTLDNSVSVPQCPTFVKTSAIQEQGPWIFLQDGSTGTFRPFVIQSK